MADTHAPFFRLPWRSRATIARDVDAELSFHLEMRVSELTAQGVGAAEARQRARAEFGDLERTRLYCRVVDERASRATRTADRLAEWRQDTRYAWRTLCRSPGYAALSLFTLALAIGANTAIFSVTRAVLLAPLPYGDPASLVAVTENGKGQATGGAPLSPANFVDYEAQQHTLTDLAAYMWQQVTWRSAKDDPTIVSAVAVTPDLFSMLRVPALHGRTFVSGEDPSASALQVVVSYDFWERELGGDVASIGRRITVDDTSYDVIGVMPRGFTLGLDEAMWVPLGLSDLLADPVRSRKQHYLRAVGRLKPGVTIGAARTDLSIVGRRLAAQYPDADSGRAGYAVPLREAIAGDLRTALLLLQGATGMVLLIACANLANLTLSRTLGRHREMAVRAALGAGRGRLVRQLLTESVLLALAGGALGVAIAVAATHTLLALNPGVLPAMFTAGVDGRVLMFSVALSVVTGVLVGLVPALDTARANLQETLQEGGRGTSAGRGGERVRRTLVVVQVGLAVMLLIGAGLLIRSFDALTRVRMGFDPEDVLTARTTVSGVRYDSNAAQNHFYDDVLGTIARSPGVVAAGAAVVLPTAGRLSTTLRVEGEPADEANLPEMGYISIRGDYFKALRIPLLAGREYDATDVPDGAKTVIINAAAARRFFPKGDAVGRRIRIGPDPHGQWMTIVGVVGDIRDEGLAVPAKPTLFANDRQDPMRSLAIVVRTSGDPRTAVPALRQAVRDEDPAQAIRDVKPLGDVVGSSLAPRRFVLGLATCFAIIALLLAAIGIYGVLAYVVSSRTREFGVRLALGATARSVLLLVAGQGLGWSLLGLALGLGGAVAGGRLLAGTLYGVDPIDATTYVSIVAGLLVVVAVACIVPAARATRVDPLASMRAD